MADLAFGFDTTQKASLKRMGLDTNTPPVNTDLPLAVQVANLNAWATALATKLNADAGVTDTNYDTTPQS